MDLLGSAHSLLGNKTTSNFNCLRLGSSKGMEPSQYDANRNGIIYFINNFLGFLCYYQQKGLTILKSHYGLAGTAMFVMSILFILLAVGAPFINSTVEFATPNMSQVSTYIPKFDFSYFTTVSMLVFAVGGAEKFLHVNATKNPAKEFPKGMIFLAAMVGLSVVLGSFAMGMLFSQVTIFLKI